MSDLESRLAAFAAPEVPVPVPATVRRRGERIRRRRAAAVLVASVAAVALVVGTATAVGGLREADPASSYVPRPTPTPSPSPTAEPIVRKDGWLQGIPASVRIDLGLRDRSGQPLHQQHGGPSANTPEDCIAGHHLNDGAQLLKDRLTIAGDPFPENRTLRLFASQQAASDALAQMRAGAQACPASAEGGYQISRVRDSPLGEEAIVVLEADHGTGAGNSYNWWRVVQVGNALLLTSDMSIAENAPFEDHFDASVARQGEALKASLATMCVFAADGCQPQSSRCPEVRPIAGPSGVGALQLGASPDYLRALPGATSTVSGDEVGRIDVQQTGRDHTPLEGSVTGGYLTNVSVPDGLQVQGIHDGSTLEKLHAAFPPAEMGRSPGQVQVTAVESGSFSSRYVFMLRNDQVTSIAVELASRCREEPPANATVMGPDGLGDLRLGMSRADAVGLPGARVLEQSDGRECDAFVADGISAALGRDELLEVFANGSPALATPEGITTGSSLGQVQAAYPRVHTSDGSLLTPAPGRSASSRLPLRPARFSVGDHAAGPSRRSVPHTDVVTGQSCARIAVI